MTVAEIGIIGGSGLYKMDALTDVEEREIQTPFGRPSDACNFGYVRRSKIGFFSAT